MKTLLTLLALACALPSYGQKLSALGTKNPPGAGDKFLILDVAAGVDKTVLYSNLFPQSIDSAATPTFAGLTDSGAFNLTGTGGVSFLDSATQSSNPSSPSGGHIRLFINNGGVPSWKNSTANVFTAASLEGDQSFLGAVTFANLTVTTANITTANVTTLSAKADVIEASLYAADAGANDTYVATLSPAITSYVTGTLYLIKCNTANTGAATINLNGVGAKTIKKAAGGITTDLADNDIRAGQVVLLQYDGTNMLLQSTLGNAPAGALTSTLVGYGDGSNALTGEAAFAYNATTNIETVGGVSLGAGGEVSTIGPLVDAVDGTTPLNNAITAYGTGTAYSLTNTSAAVAFGTTSPLVTITNAGTYLLFGRVVLKYNGSTFVANRTVTLKIRRTNNTAADVASSTSVLTTGVVTTFTATFLECSFPPVKYTTTNTNDTVTIFADVDTVPSAGSLDASAASLVAERMY